MLLYQDIITGDEMLSDAFDVYVQSSSGGSRGSRERAVTSHEPRASMSTSLDVSLGVSGA
jgi:hypothetical protein